MDITIKEENQGNIFKLEELMKNMSQHYNQIEKGHETSANYYYFLDLHEILITESKQAKSILEKIDPYGMLKLEQTLFNATYQAALDWKNLVYEYYFEMKEKKDKVSVRNITDDQNATFYKFTRAHREFQRFHSLYSRLLNGIIGEFYKYLKGESVNDDTILFLQQNNIGFKQFLQFDNEIFKQYGLNLYDRLIMKSILEQFGK